MSNTTTIKKPPKKVVSFRIDPELLEDFNNKVPPGRRSLVLCRLISLFSSSGLVQKVATKN